MIEMFRKIAEEQKNTKTPYGEGIAKGIEVVLEELERRIKEEEEMKINEKVKVQTKYMGEQEINEVALFTEIHKDSGMIWYKLEGRIGMNRYLIALFQDKSKALKAHEIILKKLLAAQTKEAKILLEQ